MRCNYCGANISDGSMFCSECGNRMYDDSPDINKMNQLGNGQQEATVAGTFQNNQMYYNELNQNPNNYQNDMRNQQGGIMSGHSAVDYSAELNDEDDDTDNKNKILIILLLVVLMLMLMAIGVVLFLKIRNGDKKKPDSASETVTWETQEQIGGGSKNSDIPLVQAPDSSSDEGITAAEYCNAYKEYIESEGLTVWEYAFIDINGDDIYELLLGGSCEAEGNVVLTYSKQGVNAFVTSRLGYNYIPGQNLFCNADGHMGYYYDNVYSIIDGKWQIVGEGSYSEQYDDNGEIVYDQNGNFLYKYTWNNMEVTKNNYYSSLAAVYDDTDAVRIPEYMPAEKLMGVLQSGKPELTAYNRVYYEDSTDIHRYEIIVSDVSWYKAKSECEDRGGYLVHINSDAEYQYILNMIYNQGYEDKVFWLGAEMSFLDYNYHWVGPKIGEWTYYNDSKETLESNPLYDSYWLPGEPSYTSDDGNGNTFSEEYIDMFYSKKEQRFVWNDAPADLISVVPSYSGKVAYICEYDN